MPESIELRRVLNSILSKAETDGGFITVLNHPETHASLLRSLVMLHQYQDRQIAQLEQRIQKLEEST